MKYFFNPFAGEIGRLYWWVSQLLIFIFAIVLLFATAILFADPDAPVSSRNGSEISSLLAICVLAVYMNFCTSLNRLRDAGRSGWWWLAFNIPFIGSPLMLYMCGVLPGSGSLNAEYGAISALDADDIIRRYQEGQSQAAHYTPPAPQPSLETTPSRPRPTLQTPQGFGKRKGFQGNWG